VEASRTVPEAPRLVPTGLPGAAPDRDCLPQYEFGLGEAPPIYSGGLGILAGDYLKAASDLARTSSPSWTTSALSRRWADTNSKEPFEAQAEVRGAMK
jgi:hypothetical protein